MRNGLGLGRFCRRIRAAWRALTTQTASRYGQGDRNGAAGPICGCERQAPRPAPARHSGADTSMRSAVDSLERLKTKQAERAATFEAASELAASTEEVSLDDKLKAAGIVDGGASGGDVLARLKAKRPN